METKLELKNDLSFIPINGKVTIGKFNVIFDIDELAKKVNSLKWNAENYAYDSEINGGYRSTKLT